MKYKVNGPAEIEAFQYDGDLMDSNGKYYVPDWAVNAFENKLMFYDAVDSVSPPCELFVSTINGVKMVNAGDYVVRAANNCFLVIGEKIFNEIFKSAE